MSENFFLNLFGIALQVPVLVLLVRLLPIRHLHTNIYNYDMGLGLVVVTDLFTLIDPPADWRIAVAIGLLGFVSYLISVMVINKLISDYCHKRLTGNVAEMDAETLAYRRELLAKWSKRKKEEEEEVDE